jgi:hypothetical protein
MGVYTNKFLPRVKNFIRLSLNKCGIEMFNTDDSAEIYLQHNTIKFKINNNDELMTISEDGSITGNFGDSQLPSQAGNAGKYLTTDGSDASWDDPTGTTDHTELSNIGTNTHAEIDTHITNTNAHIADSSNPHSTTAADIGVGELRASSSYYSTSGTKSIMFSTPFSTAFYGLAVTCYSLTGELVLPDSIEKGGGTFAATEGFTVVVPVSCNISYVAYLEP